MICCSEGEGWRFITQPAHAWLSGEIAAAWGNRHFARPAPCEAVVLATRLHDIGWLAWDAAPRLDESGRPVNFLAAELTDTLPMWRIAARRVELIDPYAALLVSMHGSFLFSGRLEGRSNTPAERLMIEDMLSEHESMRAEIRARLAGHPLYNRFLDGDHLNLAYRWLRVCDILSLILCADVMPASGNIPSVPGVDDHQRVDLGYTLLEPFKLAIDPWPFSTSALSLAVHSRYLEGTSFVDESDLRIALVEAVWTNHTIEIVPG